MTFSPPLSQLLCAPALSFLWLLGVVVFLSPCLLPPFLPDLRSKHYRGRHILLLNGTTAQILLPFPLGCLKLLSSSEVMG